MRRNFRRNSGYVDSKVITFSILGVVLLATVVFGILMYGKNVDDNVRNSQLSSEQIANLIQAEEEESESASTNIGKSVEDAESEKEAKTVATKEDDTNLSKANSVQNVTSNTAANTTSAANTATKTTSNNASSTTAKATSKETEVKKELKFQKPVEGEIIREYAKDSLVFSQTLDEWVTHLGIDIKAEKATVVQAAEDGIVKSIKNDPRYGLTVVISHQDGFETVYANLLSSEFVKEGDKIKKGQSIGTVGNTGVFESADEPHLHFEMLKDSAQVDPSIYLK